MKRIIYYQKPEEICYDKIIYSSFADKMNFIHLYKKCIEDKIVSRDFKLRLASMDDICSIEQLIDLCYSKEAAKDSNPYDFYRFITYGHGLLVEDKNSRLIGCLFEEPYDSDDKTSYTLRLAIDQQITCKELGTLLLEYSCLIAMERGSRVKRGLLLSDNFISTHILINKLGWICDNFYPDLKWVYPSFTISLPLTIDGFLYNRVDVNKLVTLLKGETYKKPYRLVEWNDKNRLQQLFSDGYIIIAFIKEGLISERHLYFAVPIEDIEIKIKHENLVSHET